MISKNDRALARLVRLEKCPRWGYVVISGISATPRHTYGSVRKVYLPGSGTLWGVKGTDEATSSFHHTRTEAVAQLIRDRRAFIGSALDTTNLRIQINDMSSRAQEWTNLVLTRLYGSSK